MALSEQDACGVLEQYGQRHVLRFWDRLDKSGRAALLGQIENVDFPLVARLIDEWINHEPSPDVFREIQPISTIPPIDCGSADSRAAWDAGEEALRAGRVGLLLVAGGQGTRLGFDGPKGAYPIGPVSGKSLFQFHAEKIHNLQSRYGCVLPWYIMVSETTHEPTRVFFQENGFFGLGEKDIFFFEQRMMPCADLSGKFILEAPGRLAMNPNGHGGTIPAVVENGIIEDAQARGIDLLSYFQVDNWAVKVADPFFIGYHVLRDAQMSSKVHRKSEPRESVGVHCLCDGKYRTIEYTELDIYTQLLETDDAGHPVYYAGNTAIHVLSVNFVEDVFKRYDEFPWHRSNKKKIRCVNADGVSAEPETENGYKFETFVFDALRFTNHPPVALEIKRAGEYTPTKSPTGANSVESSLKSMRDYWGAWLKAAGCPVPRDDSGEIAVDIEISPQFALSKHEFLEKVKGHEWPSDGPIAIAADGGFLTH